MQPIMVGKGSGQELETAIIHTGSETRKQRDEC